MSDAARAVFEAAASGYDRLRRQLIPCFDGFYGAAVDLLRFDRGAPLRVLDLGAGTGLLAGMVVRRFPRAELTLLDGAEAMLEKARERLASEGARVHFVAGDYRTAPLGGPYDAIVSALSIHHLEDAEKRALYRAAAAALAPGGVFVNADNVCAEDPAAQVLHRAAWIEAIRATGISEAELEAALERTKVDVLAPLGAQLGWLREAGLERVGLFYAWHHFAVFAGSRP